MVHLLPFAALRYDPAKVPMGHVLSHPRELLRSADAEDLAPLFAASPYSAVRLEMGCIAPGVTDHESAASLLEEWRRDSILVKDEPPGIYLYEQTAGSEQVCGLIALLRLKDYALLPENKADSEHQAADLTQLRAMKLQCAPVVASYKADDATDSACDLAMRSARLILDIKDGPGTRHRLWLATDSGVVLQLRDCFAPRDASIYLGHERCVTHVNYRNERRADDVAKLLSSGRTGQLAVDANAPYEWMMTALFPDGAALPELPAGLIMYALEG